MSLSLPYPDEPRPDRTGRFACLAAVLLLPIAAIIWFCAMAMALSGMDDTGKSGPAVDHAARIALVGMVGFVATVVATVVLFASRPLRQPALLLATPALTLATMVVGLANFP